MNFCFFSTAICTALESASDENLSSNYLIPCSKHQEDPYSFELKEPMSIFNNEIINVNCILNAKHAETLDFLLWICDNCEDCTKNFLKQKILCKSCSSSQDNLDLEISCEVCKKLEALMKKFEIIKLFMNKILVGKYSNDAIQPIFEVLMRYFSDSAIKVIFSELNYDFEDLEILNKRLCSANENHHIFSSKEIEILNAFLHTHEIMKKNSPKSLLEALIGKDHFSKGFLYYLAVRFNFEFYSEISSLDLFDIIKSIATAGSNFDIMEFDTFMKDLLWKIDILGFISNKKDFLELIDVLAENQISQKYLVKFLENKKYFKNLTEERIILLLMKIFNIESIETACLAKNLSIFNNFDDDIDDQKKKEFLQQEISIPSANLEKNYLDSMNAEYGETYLIYKKMIENFLNNFTNYTPSGQVKIACIIFSLLDSENVMVKEFKDMLDIFYSGQDFSKSDILQVSDIIKLHLIYNVPFQDFEYVIKSIFSGIKKDKDVDIIFDHVFNAPNKRTMIDVFVKILDPHSLSDSRLDQLIKYTFEESKDGQKDLIRSIYLSGIRRNTNLMIKYFPKLLNQLDKIHEYFFKWMKKYEAYAHLSKNDLDMLLKCCLNPRYYGEILYFIEYLDYDQLESINKRKFDLITKKTDNSIKFSQEEIFKYLGTPFSYRILEYYISAIFSYYGKSENDFYGDILFKEVLLNPLFQKFYNESKLKKGIFNNEYMNRITDELFKFNKTHPNAWKVFFDNLSPEQKIPVKENIFLKIYFHFKRKKRFNYQKMSVENNASHVKDLLKRCLDIPLESKIEKVDFFLENFDFENYSLAKQYPEELKKVISELDLQILFDTYNELNEEDTSSSSD